MSTQRIFIMVFCIFSLLTANTSIFSQNDASESSSNASGEVILLAQADDTASSDEDAGDSEEIKQLIDNGRRYYRQRLYEKAIEEWNKALELSPNNSKIQKYITRAQAKLGISGEQESAEEQETAQPAQSEATGQVDEMIDQGRNFYREGKYEEAIAVWEKAYKLDPENKRLQRYLVKAREKVAEETGAEPVTETPPATTAQPAEGNAELLVSQGKEYFRMGEYQKAIDEWKKALELTPGDTKIQKYIEKAQRNLDEEQPAETTEETPAVTQEEIPTEEIATPAPIIEEEEDVVRRDLSFCVKVAIENHREAKIAIEKIKKAEIDLFIARRNFFPNLFFVYSQAQGGSGAEDTGSNSTRDFVRNRYKFQASHMVYSGGKARSEVQKAHIALDIEKKEYQRIVNQKALEVAKAYYEVARTEADLKVQRGLLSKAQASLQLVEEQFKSGLVSELELLNLKAQINQIHSQVAAAQQELSHAVLDLQNVMNIDLTTPIRVYALEDNEIELDTRYEDIPLIQNIQIFDASQQSVDEKSQLRQDSYMIYALKNRADFAVEQLKLQKAEKEVDIAHSTFLPHFEVFGELGQGAENQAQRTSDLDLITEYLAGFKLSWNVWGNTLEVRRQEASEAPSVTKIGTEKSRTWEVAVGLLDDLEPISEKQELIVKQLEALNDLANQKNTIIEEVRDAYHNFLKAKIAKDTAKSKIEFRKKTVDLYNLQRSLGELETSKLLQSEIDLSSEQSGLHKALADYMVQLASLDTAIGKSNFYLPTEVQEQLPEAHVKMLHKVVGPKQPNPEEQLTMTGYLLKLETVTVAPATHKLVTGYKNRKWVALARSRSIDLNQYNGKRVQITGLPVNTEDWISTVLVDSIAVIDKHNNIIPDTEQTETPQELAQTTPDQENETQETVEENTTEESNESAQPADDSSSEPESQSDVAPQQIQETESAE